MPLSKLDGFRSFRGDWTKCFTVFIFIMGLMTYINLDSYGYDWFYRFRSLVIINSMMMCLFISDWLQFLTLIMKKISINALSGYLIFAFFIDLLQVIGAIYLIVRYNTYYDINRTLSRSEEKYYKIFLSTEGEGIQPKVIFILFIIVMVYRMFYQMAFFWNIWIFSSNSYKNVYQLCKILSAHFYIYNIVLNNRAYSIQWYWRFQYYIQII